MGLDRTLQFLSDLEKNNDRDWFNTNKKEFLAAKQEVDLVVEKILARMASYDLSISDIEAKKAVYRIYRDVRFSKNKLPYKNNLGASIKRGGRKSKFAGYYLHIQPGNSMLAGGIWMPPSEDLKKVRQEIDYNTEEFKDIILSRNFKKTFEVLEGEKLKTAPKDYPKDHPEIDLLRHKSFVVSHKVSDKDVATGNFVKLAVDTFEELKPFLDFINRPLEEVE